MKRKTRAHKGHIPLLFCVPGLVYAIWSLGHQDNLIYFLGLDSQGDLDFTILLPQLLECLGSQAYARKIFKGATMWLVAWVERCLLPRLPLRESMSEALTRQLLPCQPREDKMGLHAPPRPGSTVLPWLNTGWWLWVWTRPCGLTGLLCLRH